VVSAPLWGCGSGRGMIDTELAHVGPVELGLKAKGSRMDLLSSIELPHWLMIAGAVLIAVGLLGLAFIRNREAEIPEPPSSHTRMPPLPKLLDSSSRKNNQDLKAKAK
jgi:hypothetical protein